MYLFHRYQAEATAKVLISSRPFGCPANTRETFKRYTGITFDPLSPAEAASAMTLGLVFNPERAARLVAHHALQSSIPALDTVIDQVINATIRSLPKSGYQGAIQQVVNNQVIKQLITLAANRSAQDQVRAIALLKLKEIKQWLATTTPADSDWKAHYQFVHLQISSFEDKPDDVLPFTPLSVPDGAPLERKRKSGWRNIRA
jgi:hypothetical protein